MDNNTPQSNNYNLPQPIADPPLVPQPSGQTSAAPESAVPAPVPASSQSSSSETLTPEWAKAVETLTMQHIDDPRRLSDEFSKLKARYIQERYNKEIKSSDGQDK
jgi:hypothetical protein